MPVTSLIMVRFSIRKKFWKALGLLYQMTVETTGKQRKRREEMTGGNDRETTETTREPPKNDQSLNACNFLNNGPIFNPKKVLESSWSPLPNDSRNDREMTETTGGNDGNDGGNHGLVSC